MARRSLPILSESASKKILRELCAKHNISLELVKELLQIQRNNLGRGKQIGISQEFNAAIAEYIDNMETQ